MSRKRVLISALFLALMASVFTAPGIQLANAPTERLANGSFEEGFVFTPVGAVGTGWHWFDNGGSVRYTYDDETWAPVIYDGQHAQLIQIDTKRQEKSEGDRYAGIYQTVAVVPGETYELTLRGMLRGLEGDPDLCCYNYRVQVAVDYDGGADWTAVDGWAELPWDTVHPRLSPGPMESYSTTIQATGSRLTLFIRAWKKWATVGRELYVNLDAISLKGAMPADRAAPSVQLTPPDYPVAGWSYPIPVLSSNDVGISRIEFYDGNTLVSSKSFEVGLLSLSHRFVWRPLDAGRHTLRVVVSDVAGKKATARETVVVGDKGQFLRNGSFEEGFVSRAKGMVGEGWGWFDNGGAATYSFDEDSWTPVLYDGAYSQFIEINTLGLGGSEPDRYAGIYQTVAGLTPGATYELSLHGMLRVQGGELAPSGDDYRVEWGYDPAGGTDWTSVENWAEIPWDTVYRWLEPGEMGDLTTSFEAPSSTITLFLRAWKKWGTAERVLGVNLDGIRLEGYE